MRNCGLRTSTTQMWQNHMTEKFGKRVSKLTTSPSRKKAGTVADATIVPPVKARGRPKGAKNKVKLEIKPSEPKATPKATAPLSPLVKRRGRPKGAKNKIIAPQVLVKTAPAADKPARRRNIKLKESVKRKIAPVEGDPLDSHPLMHAAKWLEKNMHQAEVYYYKSRASKLGVSVQQAVAGDLLGFFNVQEPGILKQIKKNNFIASTNHGIPN